MTPGLPVDCAVSERIVVVAMSSSPPPLLAVVDAALAAVVACAGSVFAEAAAVVLMVVVCVLEGLAVVVVTAVTVVVTAAPGEARPVAVVVPAPGCLLPGVTAAPVCVPGSLDCGLCWLAVVVATPITRGVSGIIMLELEESTILLRPSIWSEGVVSESPEPDEPEGPSPLSVPFSSSAS